MLILTVYNYDVTCYVYGQTASEVTATYNGSTYSHDISGNTGIKGIALPFDFYYNGKTMKYVLPMADGRIALSEQEDMSDMAKPYVTIFNMNETGLDAVMFEVYAYDDNFQQAIGNRVLKSGGSVKYWTTEDNVFPSLHSTGLLFPIIRAMIYGRMGSIFSRAICHRPPSGLL